MSNSYKYYGLMKRIAFFVLFIVVSVLAMGQSAQDMTVKFIGKLNGNHYQRLDSVRFTNLTRGWSETIIYPDTTIVLNAIVNVNDNEFKAAGFEQNVPNPFDCNTSVDFSIPQDENVKLQLFDAAGKQCAELNVALNAGSHKFEITASKPQTYILKAVAGAETYSVRMINVGSCGGDGIKYGGYVGLTAKLYSNNEFVLGDVIQYVGYATIDGNVVESRTVTQALCISQEVILQFTHYSRPSVETLAASGIQVYGANLNGNIISDGDSPIIECGFIYGTDSLDLSSNVIASSTTGNFSVYVPRLSEATTYYYKAYATNAVGTSYGEIKMFTTRTQPIPEVETYRFPDVRVNCAIVRGYIYGGAYVISRGFLYGTAANDLSFSVESGSGIGDFSAMLPELNAGTTYYYRAFATSSSGTGYGGILSFTTEQQSGVVNGQEWVDLGLPSGTLWASCNVGANSPEDYGNYYAWAEISTKSNYSWSTYEHSNGSSYSLTKYCGRQNYGNNGYTDTLTQIELWDDVATNVWGGGWRMPTSSELNELYNNCTATWTTQNGVDGMLFSATNGNSIFFPASGRAVNSQTTLENGYYWSRSLCRTSPSSSYSLFFNSDGYVVADTVMARCEGFVVRPVRRTISLVATVVTGDVESITSGSAIFNGRNYDPQIVETAFGFLYGTDADNLTGNVLSDGTYADGGFLIAAATDLMPSTTYYYRAYATNVYASSYGEIKSFVTNAASSVSYSPASGFANGHGYVDLGLPSGTLWATCNVGASNPNEHGSSFAWGETNTKPRYAWSTYRYCNGTESSLTKYCNNSNYGNNGYTDNLTILQPLDDAATANWGTNWRTPTENEFTELRNNCTSVWVTINGVNGRLFTGPNGNKIFLPADGCFWGFDSSSNTHYNNVHSDINIVALYWTNTLYNGNANSAHHFAFDASEFRICDHPRCDGFSVRPVCTNPNK